MNNEQILMCVVALILGMLLANMLKNICGCKLVEGGGHVAPALRVGHGSQTLEDREGPPGSNNRYNFCWQNVNDCNGGSDMDNCYKICQEVGTAIYRKGDGPNTYIINEEHCGHLVNNINSAARSFSFWQNDEWKDHLNDWATQRAECQRGH